MSNNYQNGVINERVHEQNILIGEQTIMKQNLQKKRSTFNTKPQTKGSFNDKASMPMNQTKLAQNFLGNQLSESQKADQRIFQAKKSIQVSPTEQAQIAKESALQIQQIENKSRRTSITANSPTQDKSLPFNKVVSKGKRPVVKNHSSSLFPDDSLK